MTWVERVLDRPERPLEVRPLYRRALITGAGGSIGGALTKRLAELGVVALATDRESLDVVHKWQVEDCLVDYRPEVVFHLAGAKHALNGELNPFDAMDVNAFGAAMVVEAAEGVCPVVLASTCKACDPETAYGASKLIAERIALNAGHSVARFYNVVETQGNVFETWQNTPEDEAIKVTECSRYFLSLAEAVSLIIAVSTVEPGRYTLNPGDSRHMPDVARALYPGRAVEYIKPRRGDRLDELRIARCETLSRVRDGLERIRSPYDA